MSADSYKKWYDANLERARQLKRENMRRYRAADPEKYRKQTRDAKIAIRTKLFATFGRCCAICGFDDERALTLDHVLNNGAEERAVLGERGPWRRALKPEHRNDYRILCMNCQFISRVEACRENQHPRSWLQLHGVSSAKEGE